MRSRLLGAAIAAALFGVLVLVNILQGSPSPQRQRLTNCGDMAAQSFVRYSDGWYAMRDRCIDNGR